MIRYRDTLAEMLPKVQIHDGFRFSWYGRTFSPVTPRLKRSLTAESVNAFFQNSVRNHLYQNLYCTGGPRANDVTQGAGGAVSEAHFLEELSRANTGRGRVSRNWRALRRAADGPLALGDDGIRYRLEADTVEGDLADPDGATISVRLPKEMRGLSPGFYLAFGDAGEAAAPGRTRVRLYWNVRFEGAAPLMEAVTRSLNDAGVPFQFKVLSNPDHYDRCDAAVLYIDAEDYERVAEPLTHVHARAADHLKGETPFFTKRLAWGLGLAEEPPGVESFGQNRSLLTACGLLDAHRRSCDAVADRLERIEAAFHESGISLDAPYLQPGSRDRYAYDGHAATVVPIAAAPRRRDAARIAHREEEPEGSRMGAEQAVAVAGDIAGALVGSALWWQDRCTWVGAQGRDGSLDIPTSGPKYANTGLDLYGGGAGVAWFLAEWAARTGDRAAHRTAVGALTNGFERLDCVRPEARRSLYVGATGLAVAAVHVGLLLDEEGLVERGFAAAEQAAAAGPHEGEEPDLLLGTAGSIVGWLLLHRTRPSARLLDAAVRASEGLLRTAAVSRQGWSWRSHIFAKQRNLTGFSHGAGGIAYALLELYGTTGETALRAAALEAFRYEQSHYVPEERNWRDMRALKAAGSRQSSRAFATQWCHGAPGIALSRIRARRWLDDASVLEQARCGLEVAAKSVEDGLGSWTAGYSLCHGQAGNAEILRLGAPFLPSTEAERVGAIVAAAAHRGRELYGSGKRPWPCGTFNGENPSLLLGTAGIGLFYLRYADAGLITPLLFETDRPLGRAACRTGAVA
jgi:hypothetical protein